MITIVNSQLMLFTGPGARVGGAARGRHGTAAGRAAKRNAQAFSRTALCRASQRASISASWITKGNPSWIVSPP